MASQKYSEGLHATGAGVSNLLRRRWVKRLAAAVLIGLAFAAYEDIFRSRLGAAPSDFLQPWTAGRLLLEGRNPYREIGPGGTIAHQFHLIYPATAASLAMPFTIVPLRLANALFAGIGCALLFWALTRHTFRNPQLLVFTAFPLTAAVQNVQWSPLLTAATFYPALGFVYACKPSVAFAYWMAYPSRRALLIAAGFTAVTLMVWPWWPREWLAQLSTVTHMSTPVTRWGGPLLLLSALRWRRPEARLLLGLSCIPQTPVIYEAVPLFLIVTTIREGVALAVVTMALAAFLPGAEGLSYDQWMATSGFWMVWFVYLPCLLLVLRRPNVAPEGDPFTATVAAGWAWFTRLAASAARPSETVR
jgi:hypothetical protein